MFSLMRSALGMQRALDNAALDEAGGTLSGGEQLRLSCRDVIEFATIEGARAAGLDHRIGSLTPGKDADVILIRTDTIGMTPLNYPAGAIVYNAHIGLVDTVLIAGEVVKRDGLLAQADAARARRLALETREHLLDEALKNPTISDIALGGDWIPKVEAPV